MIDIVSYEQVTSRLSGHQDLFLKTWSPFLDYIKNRQCPRNDLTHHVEFQLIKLVVNICIGISYLFTFYLFYYYFCLFVFVKIC